MQSLRHRIERKTVNLVPILRYICDEPSEIFERAASASFVLPRERRQNSPNHLLRAIDKLRGSA
jgi:hypothetical protein